MNLSHAKASLYLSKVISTEVENFIDSQSLSEKNLRIFEKELEKKLRGDSNIEFLLNSMAREYGMNSS